MNTRKAICVATGEAVDVVIYEVNRYPTGKFEPLASRGFWDNGVVMMPIREEQPPFERLDVPHRMQAEHGHDRCTVCGKCMTWHRAVSVEGKPIRQMACPGDMAIIKNGKTVDLVSASEIGNRVKFEN